MIEINESPSKYNHRRISLAFGSTVGCGTDIGLSLTCSDVVKKNIVNVLNTPESKPCTSKFDASATLVMRKAKIRTSYGLASLRSSVKSLSPGANCKDFTTSIPDVLHDNSNSNKVSAPKLSEDAHAMTRFQPYILEIRSAMTVPW